MPDFGTALTVGGSLLGAKMSSDAAGDAASIQAQAAQAGIDEQARQFDAVRALLAPYVKAGQSGINRQKALLGLLGPDAQLNEIRRVERSPYMTELMQQGESAILQNASATGGLRGGNVQGALAQYRPAFLASLIDQQYNRLAGLSSLGQNAAAGVGNAGMLTGTNIANLYGQQGAAQAGGALGSASAWGNAISDVTGALSTAFPTTSSATDAFSGWMGP